MRSEVDCSVESGQGANRLGELRFVGLVGDGNFRALLAQPLRHANPPAEETQTDDAHPPIGERFRGFGGHGVHFVRDSNGPRVSVVASVSSHVRATSSSS